MKVIALAATAVTMVLVIATAVLFSLDGVFGADPLSNALGLLGIACYAAIGGLITWRLPRNACGWLLLWIGGGLALGLLTDALKTFGMREGYVTLASWAAWANAFLLFSTVLPGIVLYLLVFPTGRPPSPRWRPVAIAVVALSVVGSLGSVLQPFDVGDPENPTAVASLEPVLGPLLVAILFGFVAMAVLSVASVVVRFRRAAAPERLLLRWLVVVGVLAALLLVGAIAFGALAMHRIGDPLGVALILMLTTGLPISAGIALLRHHLYGIEVVANRAIVYGSLAATITAIYAAIVAGVGAAVGGGDRPNVFAAVAATAIAAIAFQPVRRRAQVFADRVIYGERASPYELLAMFTERLDEASLHEILPRMTTLIAEGTGADRVRIWLRDDGEMHAVAGWPIEALPVPVRLDGAELPDLGDRAFAVRHGGDLLGAISVGMPPQEPMTSATERLLVDLSAQAGLVLRNVALVEELQRSRQRLVTSQDEARRRLERDLHDGAQQRLVALSLDLRMARDRADASGDVELATRLDAAERELKRSLGELRELARGIHPAILTQNGLGAALRSLAERSAVPVELRTAPERRFSPEVEATAYFIVSEALANVAKHADASQAWVSVEDGGGRLAIEVRDDGIGGAAMNGGSGLQGLADRAEAVGGRIDVRSEPGAGSIVLAEIPCASR